MRERGGNRRPTGTALTHNDHVGPLLHDAPKHVECCPFKTGLNQAFSDNLAYDISGTYTGGATLTAIVAGAGDKAAYEPTFLGFSPPPPGSLYSATSFQAAHFNFRATGESATNLSIVLNGGAYQIAPKQ